jgi:hypothetical protein
MPRIGRRWVALGDAALGDRTVIDGGTGQEIPAAPLP